MPVFLKERATDLTEQMDRSDCDPELLENTYRQFHLINKLLSKWTFIYRKRIRPAMKKGQEYTLLDIGFGGGDIPLLLSEMARKDGFSLNITAIESDPRAFTFAESLPPDPQVHFRNCSSDVLLEERAVFDFVISNHLIHHLKAEELKNLLNQAELLSKQVVIFNDIERSDIGYSLFSVIAPLVFRKSFIVEDGLISIKKSYTRNELRAVAPDHWQVSRSFPYRLLLTHTH